MLDRFIIEETFFYHYTLQIPHAYVVYVIWLFNHKRRIFVILKCCSYTAVKRGSQFIISGVNLNILLSHREKAIKMGNAVSDSMACGDCGRERPEGPKNCPIQ